MLGGKGIYLPAVLAAPPAQKLAFLPPLADVGVFGLMEA
jgi:hypothetical protein